MDPITMLFEQWAEEREVFRRSGSAELIALSETHARELRGVLNTLSGTTVPYRYAEELTGFALGSLKNTIENVGTRGDPAFRLRDLPFKAGRGSPAKVVMARSVLIALEGR